MAESFLQAVDDILECPICIETMNDTRVLPCIHTFCLKCIQQHGKDIKRGETVDCPCCRKTCPVPAGGFPEFPKNILLEKLLEIRFSMEDHINSLGSEIKALKSQILEKKALERENRTLKSEIVNIEQINNQTLKTQAAFIEKIKNQNDTLKVRDVEMKQLKQEIETLKSRFSYVEKYEREIESKAKDALVEKLKNEIASLKSKIAELSQHQMETEFHHVMSLETWHSGEIDCRVQSCDQLILLCRSCRNEMCLNCFTRRLRIAQERTEGALSFLLFIVVILIAALIYVSR